jgi:hypothetical protein
MRYLSVKVMKKTLLLFLLLTATIVSFAQFKLPSNRSSAGVEIFVPTGNLSKTHFLGLSANLQMEMRNPKNPAGILLFSGYNYCLPKSGSKSFVMFPALVGVKYHLTNLISTGSMMGVSFVNRGGGIRYTYSMSMGFENEDWSTDIKFGGSTFPGHENDYSGFSVRFAYRL